MVMDLYSYEIPIHEDPIYTLEKWTETSERPTNLGIFDQLETALHALDFVSKFNAGDLKVDDYFAVLRMAKNSLKRRPIQLVRWTCTGESKNGCYVGRIELLQGLRTHAVDKEPL